MAIGKYEGIVAAAMKGESALWELGDALIREVGEPRLDSKNDGSYKNFSLIIEELRECGIEQYNETTLGKIRKNSFAFPAPRRARGVGFWAHMEAGSPEMLETTLSAAKAKGLKTVSKPFVREVRKQIEREEKEARKEARHDAIEAKKEAQREAAQFKEDKRRANDPDARAEAARRQREAEERAREAEMLAEQLKGPPAINHSAKKKGPAESPMLVVRTSFASDMSNVRRLVERMDQNIDPHLDDLPDSFIAMATEELLELAEAFRKLSAKVRSRKVNKRTHLYAVGE